MRTHAFATVAIAGLLLAGCSSTPPVEPDEDGYLEVVRVMLAGDDETLEDDELLKIGHNLCDQAEDEGVSLSEAATKTARTAAALSETSESEQRWLLDPVEIAAGSSLCPQHVK